MEMLNGIKMYTSKEVRDILNIGESAYRRLRKRRLLRSVTLRGRLLTSEEAIQEYLRGETLPPAKDQEKVNK